MEDGGIRDTDIRATSSLNASASAIHGRLNHTGGYGGWCPDQQPYYNGTGPIHKEFIQVEFPRPFRIKGIITQPRARGVEGIRRFLVLYRQDQENNEAFAWLYDGRSCKPRVSHFKDLHKDVFLRAALARISITILLFIDALKERYYFATVKLQRFHGN